MLCDFYKTYHNERLHSTRLAPVVQSKIMLGKKILCIISSLRCEQRKLKKAIFSTLKGVSREISSK